MADLGLAFRITADARGAMASLGQFTNQISGIRQRINQFGSDLQSVGTKMTAAITLPLVGLGTAAAHSALQLDAFRNRLTATEGSAEAAEKRILKLQALAQSSVGVTTKAALDSFSQLSAIGGITEQTIEKQIKALGRLNAAFTIDDPAQFNRNLVQIFSQGFERADIKEAIGRVPIFEQLLESAFGTQDGAKLKALKEAGKLTLDGFLSGLSEAVETSPNLSRIGESLSVKLQKSFERFQFALAPLGAAILGAIEPFIEPAIKFIERLSKAFAGMSDSTKLGVVAFGAVAAAAGPLVTILGTLIVAITSVGAPFVAVAAIVTAAVAGMAAAYTTNFLGIRDLTDSVLKEILAFVQQHIGVLVSFWNENLPLIQKTVETVLNAIKVFWEANGEDITRIVKAAWEIIKTVISTVTQVILGIIKLTMQIINEDWGGAWQTFQKICQVAMDGIGKILLLLKDLAIAAVRAAILALLALGAEIHQRMLSVGAAIVAGIIAGVISKQGELMKVMRNLALQAVIAATTALVIRSPSQKFFEVGEAIVDGLINGLTAGHERVRTAIEALVAAPDAAVPGSLLSTSTHFRGRIGRPPGGPRVSDEDNAAIDAPIPPPGFLDSFLQELNRGQEFALGFGNTVSSAFGSMASAIGQAAAASVVYGKSFGSAIKDALKQALAAIAAESVVQAIYNLAKGFAALAGFMPGPAALYFKAAALYGVAAVAAGGAAAAVSGGGGAGASSGAPGNFASSGFSREAEGDRTRREPRAGGTPDPLSPTGGHLGDLTLNIADGDEKLEKRIVRIYRRNGQLRGVWRSDTLGEATA